MWLQPTSPLALNSQKTQRPGLPCPGTEPGSRPAAQTLQKKSFCGRHRGTLGTDWQPLKRGEKKINDKTPFEFEKDRDVNTETPLLPPSSTLVGSGALVSLTPLAGVVLLKQCRAEVADVLGEEAGVLHPRLWRRVQAVGPVAVIQVLHAHKPNTLIFFGGAQAHTTNNVLRIWRNLRSKFADEAAEEKIRRSITSQSASTCVRESHQTADRVSRRVRVPWRLTARSQNGRYVRNPGGD